MLPLNRPQRSPVIALAWLAVAIVFACLILRNGGIVPFAFADEQYYSLYSRLVPMTAAILPDYLYFAVFRSTLVCGDGFLDCVRGLNVMFFLASAPFIYLATRRVAGRFASAWVVGLVILGPLNSVTAYFMPESMYFFLFWAVSWLALGFDEQSTAWHWGALGVLLGALSLVKPHALFLLPALSVFAIYTHLQRDRAGAGKTALALMALVVCTIALKFAVGYALVGPQGVTLFGHFYSGVTTTSSMSQEQYIRFARHASSSLGAHVLSIIVALGLACGAAIGLAFRGLWHPEHRAPIQRLAVYSVLVIGSLIAVVSLFTASLAVHDVGEVARIHQRYYDFSLPLLLMVASALAGGGPIPLPSKPWRACLAVLVIGALGMVFAFRFQGIHAGIVDGPWFNGLFSRRRAWRVVGFLMAACAALWPLAPRAAAGLLLYVALPLSCLWSAAVDNAELAQHTGQTVYERAGKVARMYLPPDELARLVVVCSDPSEGFRVLYSIDNAGAAFQLQADGVSYRAAGRTDGNRWVLSMGDRPAPMGAVEAIRMPGFSLARLPAELPSFLPEEAH